MLEDDQVMLGPTTLRAAELIDVIERTGCAAYRLGHAHLYRQHCKRALLPIGGARSCRPGGGMAACDRRGPLDWEGVRIAMENHFWGGKEGGKREKKEWVVTRRGRGPPPQRIIFRPLP